MKIKDSEPTNKSQVGFEVEKIINQMFGADRRIMVVNGPAKDFVSVSSANSRGTFEMATRSGMIKLGWAYGN